MNAQPSKWRGYTPAEAYAMESALASLYAKEINPNAGKMPINYDPHKEKYAYRKKGQSEVYAAAQNAVMYYIATNQPVTRQDVGEAFGISWQAARRRLVMLVDDGLLDVEITAPNNKRLYRLANVK